jgi:MFS family permease
MNCSYCFSAYPAGVLSDYLGRVKLLITGFALYALIYLGFAFAQTQWQIWGLFAFYGLHLGISKGVLSALIADRVPKELRGTGFGFINLATGIALLFASLIAGGLWQYYGAGATFLTGSIFACAATVMLIWEEKQS